MTYLHPHIRLVTGTVFSGTNPRLREKRRRWRRAARPVADADDAPDLALDRRLPRTLRRDGWWLES
jgi:hypothetical protein